MLFLGNTNRSFYTRLKDMFILNICFIISCLPIITIGAASVAMYSVLFNMDDKTNIIKSYKHRFRYNYRQSTLVWLLIIIVGTIIYLDYAVLGILEINFWLVSVVLYIDVYLVIGVASYSFGMMAMFNNSTKQTIKNALIFCISMPIKTIIMVLVTLSPVIVLLLNAELLPVVIVFWLLFGFEICSEINARRMKDIFASFPVEE